MLLILPSLLLAIAVTNNLSALTMRLFIFFFPLVSIRSDLFLFAGVRELVKVTRKSQDDDLMNSAIGGLFSGALLGRLQGSLSV